MRLNSKQIALYTGGTYLIEPIDASEIMTGITWDSRDVKPGDLYVALPGERVDGHDFVEPAIRGGARGTLVSEAPSKSACVLARELGVAVIEVPNTYHAIEDLAREWRSHINAKVVAITGSVGKTTTKNLVRDVCAARFKTVATAGNQNNELGVPNTILAADPDTDVVVVEMGMRGMGQISHLCKIARPDWGLVTNVGECHMELLGSKENIVKAKSELFSALPEGMGTAFVNADDESSQQLLADAQAARRRLRLACFGTSGGACDDFRSGRDDVTGCVFSRELSLDAEGRADFLLCVRGFNSQDDAKEPTLFDMEPDVRTARCHLSLRGVHNVGNACSAAAVGIALGMDIHDIAQALSASVSETGRLETLKARDGYMVINDAYNANPDSMRAALSMLSAMDVSGRRVAVLGDMGELGDVEIACHLGVGAAAAEHGVDKLVCIGDLASHIAEGAVKAGLPEDSVVSVSSLGGALEVLEGDLCADDVVLVKASHFMRLDRLVEGLVS